MTRTFRVLVALMALTLAFALGCSPATESDTATDAADTGDDGGTLDRLTIRFGTLATEDSLPFWVAEQEGLFDEAAIDFEITTFQSAAERDIAMTAGEIDCMMGDIIATGLLENGGMDVSIVFLMLGGDASQGRFGIVTKPDSDLTGVEDLEGVAIGTSLGTIQEYVVDRLTSAAGVTDVVKESVPKVPVRFELLMEGQLEAAALPEPLLSLAQFNGGTLVIDDVGGENISQTVLIASDEYLDTEEGAEAMTRLQGVWNEAVEIINASPNEWIDMLVDNARLPEPLVETYQVNSYPRAMPPTPDQVREVVDWMKDADLINGNIPYNKMVWQD